MIGSLTAAAIAANHRPQVQAPDHLHHEPRQMPLRQPLVHRRRQQETGVAVDRAEGAHARKIRRAVINGPRILAEPSQRVKSDGLLVGAILLEQSDEWATQRSRYMTLETIGPLSDTAVVSLPAVTN